VVENLPGANGIVATGNIAKAAPDGYTILITTGAHIANAFVAKDLPYDVIKDFAPGTELAASYGLALITNLPVNSVPELVALARSKPGQLTYATNGIGNITHVAGLLFDARTGTQMVPVQYNTPQLTADVISGTVNMTFFSVAAAAPLVKSGQIKALAVTGSRRSPSLPDTPTLQELGYKDYDVTGYFGLLFPMGTPRERIDRIHREALKALETPEVRRVIDAGGFYAVGGAPERFAAFLKQDYDHQNRLMTELGLKAK
jgi:tripartite-type tricarboxylate transporter receptor subunit TctC